MIVERVGDAARPIERPACIVHGVNDLGRWGAGFTAHLEAAHPWAAAGFRRWAQQLPWVDGPIYAGGNAFVHHAPGDPALAVAHVVTQCGVRSRNNPHPAIPSWMARGFSLAAEHLRGFYPEATVHMPRIGTGLGGLDWTVVHPLVARAFHGFTVYVYTLPSKP